MTTDHQGFAVSLQQAASVVPSTNVYAVLYGTESSLPKRQEIKEKIEASSSGLTVHLLDTVPFPEGITTGERDYARGAIANIFLVDPEWKIYGASHELSTVIEFQTLHTVLFIHPDEGGWDDRYSSQAAREIVELIPELCREYYADQWEECREITNICERWLTTRRKLLELLPNRVLAP